MRGQRIPNSSGKSADQDYAWCPIRVGWLIFLLGPAVYVVVWMVLGVGLGVHVVYPILPTLALGLLMVAYSDWRQRRIPNWVTYPLCLWGIVLNGLPQLLYSLSVLVPSSGNADGRQDPGKYAFSAVLDEYGTIGFGAAIAGLLGCFLVKFVIYSVTRTGAGDVKLAAAIGAFLGLERGLLTICYTYILAGMCAACLTILVLGVLFAVRSVLRFVGVWTLPETPEMEEASKRFLSNGLPLAPFFALGTLVALAGIPQASWLP